MDASFFVFNKDMVTLSFRCFPYKVNMKKKQGFTFARNFPNIVKDKKKNRGIAMKFIYTRIKDEIRIDKIEDPEAVIYVPEEFEDCPVTELGSYVLAHSAVEEIHLPPYVRKIGAYGFYECEQLKRIYCYSRVLDLGAGLFAGVPAVEYLDITEFPGERSCLKEMLAELRQTLRVQLHQMPAAASEAAEEKKKPVSGQAVGEMDARLIFPEYYEDSVENTPARIVSIETHGCGHRYRYCFAGRVFQYRGYDELFPHVQVQEQEELVTELALGRLIYPRELAEKFREHYLDYVREHWKTAGKLLIQADRLQRNRVSNLEPGKLPWLVDEVLDAARQDAAAGDRQNMAGADEAEAVKTPGETMNAVQASVNLADQLGELTSLAQEVGDTEMVSWLMERRHRLRKAGSVPAAGMAHAVATALTADAIRDTEEVQPASGNPEIFGEPQRPKRKRRFEL